MLEGLGMNCEYMDVQYLHISDVVIRLGVVIESGASSRQDCITRSK